MNGLINLLCSLNINNADVLEYTKRLNMLALLLNLNKDIKV